MTPHQIRHAYLEKDNGHFFDRGTMKWFGDRMASFGTRTIDGTIYLYRKRSAWVNVFGKRSRTGRQFFNTWRFDPETGDLHHCNPETTEAVYNKIYKRNWHATKYQEELHA